MPVLHNQRVQEETEEITYTHNFLTSDCWHRSSPAIVGASGQDVGYHGSFSYFMYLTWFATPASISMIYLCYWFYYSEWRKSFFHSLYMLLRVCSGLINNPILVNIWMLCEQSLPTYQ